MTIVFKTQVKVDVEVREAYCGHFVAMTPERWKHFQATGAGWHCPEGHESVFKEPENAVLKRQLAQAQEMTNAAQTAAQMARLERDGALTRLAAVNKRAVAGVCPKCHRTFQQVARHMKSKHAE